MAMLAFGVIVGSWISATGPNAASPLLVESTPLGQAVASTTPPPAPAAAVSAQPAPTAPAQATPVASRPPTSPSGGGGHASKPPPTPSTSLPPVKHVFLIVLSAHGFNEAFGQTSTAPYLAHTLTSQGELLTNYYAVTQGELANEIALTSGQGPTVQTAANCPSYADVAPGTAGDMGQATGDGCVYPSATPTLPDQLTAAGKTSKAYVEDIGNGVAAGQAATCRHPTLGQPDGAQAPQPGDGYVTWRNPFVYFHSLIDSPSCTTSDVGLDQLAPDLQLGSSAPSLSYIVPNRCHDGSDQPCAPGQPAGLPAADTFLQSIVPQIVGSPAYSDGGLIAITFDQAPQSGPTADQSACCNPPTYPNLPPAPAPPSAPGPVRPTGGGGQVGLLLISPFVQPGTVNQISYYNHYSLLRSIEDLFGLQYLGYAADPALAGFDQSIYNAPQGNARRTARAWIATTLRSLSRRLSNQRKPRPA